MKNIFINRKRLKKRSNRIPILKRIESYKEILVLSDDDKQHLLTPVSDVFRHAKISFLSPRENKEDLSKEGNYTYHRNDLNLTGRVKNDKLKRLAQIQFDLILDLSENAPLNLFFIDKLNYTFIIGEEGNDKSLLYDLIIEKSTNDTDYLELIKQQITLLSRNGND